MTQTCQQGLWGHDPDPELGVQGHESDYPSTGSQAEGLWAARGGGSWAAAGRLAAEEEAVRNFLFRNGELIRLSPGRGVRCGRGRDMGGQDGLRAGADAR